MNWIDWKQQNVREDEKADGKMKLKMQNGAGKMNRQVVNGKNALAKYRLQAK